VNTITVGYKIELSNEDVKGCPFGAVEQDDNFFRSNTKLRKMKEIHLPGNKSYYNSGILLIDVPKF
jgi:hypothetical protein